MRRRYAAIDRLLSRRQDLSHSDQCTPGSLGRFALFCPGLKNENADGGALLSDNRAVVGRWGVGERRDGGRGEKRRRRRRWRVSGTLEQGLWEITLPGAPLSDSCENS